MASIGGSVCQEIRKPVAAEVMQAVESLSSRAQQLAERTVGKLHPVMTSECPRPTTGAGEGKVGMEYPPLFNDLRNNILSIEGSLDIIEYALSRTEL